MQQLAPHLVGGSQQLGHPLKQVPVSQQRLRVWLQRLAA